MLILVIVLLVLVLGGGGWYVGGPERGPVYSGGGIGLILFVLLILYLTGHLGPIR